MQQSWGKRFEGGEEPKSERVCQSGDLGEAGRDAREEKKRQERKLEMRRSKSQEKRHRERALPGRHMSHVWQWKGLVCY